MNSAINRHFFRHVRTRTEGFNNLCTLIHKVEEEGRYTGEVYLQKIFLGSFTLTVGQTTATQLQIDLSSFDPISEINLKKEMSANPCFEVMKDGHVVFYLSGPQEGCYVTLSASDGKRTRVVFDSKNLDKGDMVVFRPTVPGNYRIKNELGGQVLEVAVKKYGAHKYPDPNKLKPSSVGLAARGFEPDAIQTSPMQAVLISIGVPALLDFSGETS
jgi:hypothetical protein